MPRMGNWNALLDYWDRTPKKDVMTYRDDLDQTCTVAGPNVTVDVRDSRSDRNDLQLVFGVFLPIDEEQQVEEHQEISIPDQEDVIPDQESVIPDINDFVEENQDED